MEFNVPLLTCITLLCLHEMLRQGQMLRSGGNCLDGLLRSYIMSY